MKKLLFGVLITIPLFLIIYYILGGFNSLEFELIDNPPVYRLLGKSYTGSHNSDEVSSLFQTIQNLQVESRKDSSVVVVSFDRGTDEDNVHYFVAVQLTKEESLGGYEYREYSPYEVYNVRLSGHPIVLPSAEKVLRKAEDYAEENQKMMEDYSIEIYFPDGTIQLNIPVN